MPGSLRFLLILICLGGLVYGGIYTLATIKPEQKTVVKQLSSDRLFR